MKELSYYLFSEGKEYPLGCRLFAQLKIDPAKNAFFNPDKPEPLRSKLLWRLLSTYARIHNIRPVKPTAENSLPLQAVITAEWFSANKTRVYKHPRLNYDLLPEELKQRYDENAALYNQLRGLHAQLKSLAEVSDRMPERKKLAGSIVEISAVISKNWELIDAFLDAREERAGAAEDAQSNADETARAAELSALEKDRKIKANLNYIRRYYNVTNKKQEVLQRMQQLQQWGVDYERLISRIAGQQ